MYTEEDFQETIMNLIELKSEGSYWDFKAMWSDNMSLLHDVICMANNIDDRDGYLIIGIDEDNDFSVRSVKGDKRRRNTNQMVTFLRSKKFFGEVRPTTIVKTIKLSDEQEIDVIVVKKSTNTPYVLSEDYPKNQNSINADNKKLKINKGENVNKLPLKAFHVYTRVNDSNTARDDNANIDKVEHLWRKRFGINLSVPQKMNLYLSKQEDWVLHEGNLSENDYYYYSYDPQFIIKLTNRYETFEQSEFYNKLYTDYNNFNWYDFSILYNNVELYNDVCSVDDGGHQLHVIFPIQRLHQQNDRMISYHYLVENSIMSMVNKIFTTHFPIYDARDNNIEEFLICFQNNHEKESFDKYIKNVDIYSSTYDFIDNGMFKYLNKKDRNDYLMAKKIKWIYDNEFEKSI